MEEVSFSREDRLQMESLGIDEAQVRAHIEIFRRSSYFVRLNRPCTVGDGILEISPEETDNYLQIFQEAAQAGRFLKFVPASGAATRMFQALFQVFQQPDLIRHEEILQRAEEGDPVAQDFLQFVEGLDQFAFFGDLQDKMAEDGLVLEDLIQRNQFREILEYLLTEKGLAYGSLPKGLLKFHRHPLGSRTAFEEHLVEAAHYARDRNGVCRLHFTVSPEHEEGFGQLLERVGPMYEEYFGVHYEVSFSFQEASTDTIAVDPENRPFRDEEGRIFFRPGGHGALLNNLNQLRGDLIYIKNIDNVAPDRLKEPTFIWKKILGGYLVRIQETVHRYLQELKGEDRQDLKEIAAFAREVLYIYVPKAYQEWPLEDQRFFLFNRLNRPIRVCGVVQNKGEPGGAPFWVMGKEDVPSLQIVEKAQVDFDSPGQEDVWKSSTHFNPVDLVCGVRDYTGRPFDLNRYVDPEAVFISKKSKEGRELKALELPGLWNGAMSDWISLFVEVPLITFNPVKTVNDLLKAKHLNG